VERFQGAQRDTILISFGVGDPDLIAAEEEFLLKLERTNVAISRARAKCILLISEDLAYHLATAKAVKYYVCTFCQPHSRHRVPLAAGGYREIVVRD
jgi:superfamily I DNA and/or RNA helicase